MKVLDIEPERWALPSAALAWVPVRPDVAAELRHDVRQAARECDGLELLTSGTTS